MATVNIIIPAYNAAATLDATLDSVAGQTFSDWAAFVVEDGSSDGTAAAAEARASRDSRFKVVKGPGRGPGAARNAGAQQGSAEWLLFLDSDDLISADYLDWMLKTAASGEQPHDLVHCAGARLTPDGRIGEPEQPAHSDYFRRLASYCPFYTHACLVRRSAFERFGGFDASLRTCEDWDLWQRMARTGAPFLGTTRCLALYRMRPDSLTHNAHSVFEGARQVILRGHGADPRVDKPLPEFANGIPFGEAGEALVANALWCAGVLISGARDYQSFLRNADLLPLSAMDSNRAASMIQGGVQTGACALEQDWPSLWDQHGEAIRQALSIIEERCGLLNFGSWSIDALRRRTGLSVDKDEGPLTKARSTINWGDFNRLQPFSADWGWDRGTPVDRFYIEDFLDRHRADIRGRVLEVGSNEYTRHFGGERVTCSDVLHIDGTNPEATIVADLARAEHLGSELFDCIILTQTLYFVFDLAQGVRTLARILKPGGVLLLTVPGITRVDNDEWASTRYWSMTVASVTRLLALQFLGQNIQVESRGNVLAACAALQGLSQQDLEGLDWKNDDPRYQLTVLARAIKEGDGTTRPSGPAPWRATATAEAFVARLKEPVASSVMVVAAHPDDEVISAGGHLRYWPQVHIVHVTNGSPADPRYAKNAGFSDALSYALARRRETEAAISLIGLDADRLTGLDFDDQNASFQLVPLARRLHQLITTHRPAVVVTHAYEGGHPDHDATCFAIHAACQLIENAGMKAPAIVEMSSYFARSGLRAAGCFATALPVPATVTLDTAERELKQRMLDCFVSQKETVSMFPASVESFRPAARYAFTDPPPGVEVFYDRHDLGIKSEQWRSLAATALQDLGLIANRAARS